MAALGVLWASAALSQADRPAAVAKTDKVALPAKPVAPGSSLRAPQPPAANREPHPTPHGAETGWFGSVTKKIIKVTAFITVLGGFVDAVRRLYQNLRRSPRADQRGAGAAGK
jgi:hypothetical protein